jgi:hypothetical protein
MMGNYSPGNPDSAANRESSEAPAFTTAEKNLASLGFFTPSGKQVQ